MPSVSKSQQRLMQAAEHGADFPAAKKLRASMSHQQLHDFSVGSEANKPEHVSHHSPPAARPTPLIKGEFRDAIDSNVSTLKQRGLNEADATKAAIKKSKGYSNAHTRLGKYLHPRKDGKPHGSDYDEGLDG
jgi:hypothetical protein